MTGGIGSGKSTATKYFANLGVDIIDADEVVHKLLQPNTKIYEKILSHFGESILTTKKRLNKKKLRKIIFTHDKERLWLEKLIHPATTKIIEQQIKQTKAPYCIVVIPLLFEANPKITFDRILLIDCTEEKQISRVKKRDQNNSDQIQKIIHNQTDRDLRRKKSDDIILNNSTVEILEQQVKKLHDYYLSIAQKHVTMTRT